MISITFNNLADIMRYMKAVKPPQVAIVHHVDEFDENGIYELNHPIFEGMEGLDGWTEE